MYYWHSNVCMCVRSSAYVVQYSCVPCIGTLTNPLLTNVTPPMLLPHVFRTLLPKQYEAHISHAHHRLRNTTIDQITTQLVI